MRDEADALPDDQRECAMLNSVRGADADAVTKGEFRSAARMAHRYHIRPYEKMIEEMHGALYDADDGIIPVIKMLKTFRRWICLGATWAAALVTGALFLASKFAEFHLWPFP